MPQPITARPTPSAASGKRAQQHRRHAVDRHPQRRPPRPVVRPRMAGLAGLHRGRALPVLAVLDLADHARARGDVGVLADDGAGQQRRARADGGVVADGDRADVEVVAVDPVPGQVDLGLDRTAVPEREHAGHRRGRVQVDALADLVAQRAGVVHQPRRAGQVLRTAGLGEPLGEPHPQVHRAAAAVGAGFQTADSSIRAHSTAMPIRPSGVTNSRNPASDPPPVDGAPATAPGRQFGGDVVDQRQPDHPLQAGQRGQRQRQRHLDGLRQPRRRLRPPGSRPAAGGSSSSR